jgi:hypothetical protein
MKEERLEVGVEDEVEDKEEDEEEDEEEGGGGGRETICFSASSIFSISISNLLNSLKSYEGSSLRILEGR